jgi:phosphopantetheine adenylyltransferase
MKLFRIAYRFMISDFHVEVQFRAANKQIAKELFTEFMQPQHTEIVLVETVK